MKHVLDLHRFACEKERATYFYFSLYLARSELFSKLRVDIFRKPVFQPYQSSLLRIHFVGNFSRLGYLVYLSNIARRWIRNYTARHSSLHNCIVVDANLNRKCIGATARRYLRVHSAARAAHGPATFSPASSGGLGTSPCTN